KRPDSFGRSAGARLTVILLAGNSKPAFCSAARTRSLDSLTSVSGRPTMVKLGRPLARCTSTSTSGACMPARARLVKTARLIVLPCFFLVSADVFSTCYAHRQRIPGHCRSGLTLLRKLRPVLTVGHTFRGWLQRHHVPAPPMKRGGARA